MVERKCNPLIHSNNDIEEYCRNKHSINKWDREEVPDIAREDVFPSRQTKSLISLAYLLEKYDFPLLQLKTIFSCESIILHSEILIEFLDPFEDFFNRSVHSRNKLFSRTDHHFCMTKNSVSDKIPFFKFCNDFSF